MDTAPELAALAGLVKGLLVWDGAQFLKRRGSGVVTPGATGATRASLVPGTYLPNTPAVVGLTSPVSSLTPILSNGTDPNGVPMFTPTATLYEGKVFWAQVRHSSVGPTYRNCAFFGSDPNTFGPLVGNITSFDSSTTLKPHFTLEDCLITSRPWTIPDYPGRPLPVGTTRLMSPVSAGIHGGGFTAKRTEIVDTQDGVNYTQGHTDSSCLIEACWIHKMYYQNAWTGGPSDQQTHSDAFQFNRGKNITIRHSILGGLRRQIGYDTWPGGYNAGDDAWSECFMIKQEAGYTTYDQIRNVMIFHNWIRGGAYGVNMVYVAARPNLFQDMSFIDNIMGGRGTRVDGTFAPEFYSLNKSNQSTPIESGNIYEDTGAAAMFRNSGYSE